MTRLEQLQKLAAVQPGDPLAQFGVGLECLELGRYDEAIAAFERVLQLDARYSAAYFQKARAEFRLGRRDAAKSTLVAGLAVARANGDRHTESEMNKVLETLP